LDEVVQLVAHVDVIGTLVPEGNRVEFVAAPAVVQQELCVFLEVTGVAAVAVDEDDRRAVDATTGDTEVFRGTPPTVAPAAVPRQFRVRRSREAVTADEFRPDGRIRRGTAGRRGGTHTSHRGRRTRLLEKAPPVGTHGEMRRR
jgi:hypothetical protein